MSKPEHNLVDYERKDVDATSILRAGIALALVATIASVLVLFFFNALADRARREDKPNPPLARHEQGRMPPEPRLQEQPFHDIAALRADEKAALEGYGWVDERAGIARIPIAEALKMVARSGLPRWAPAPAQSAPPTAAATGAPASPAPNAGKQE